MNNTNNSKIIETLSVVGHTNMTSVLNMIESAIARAKKAGYPNPAARLYPGSSKVEIINTPQTVAPYMFYSNHSQISKVLDNYKGHNR